MWTSDPEVIPTNLKENLERFYEKNTVNQVMNFISNIKQNNKFDVFSLCPLLWRNMRWLGFFLSLWSDISF